MTTPLTALSPLDGRYARQTAPLAGIFSELGLLRERVRVEVAYLQALLTAIAHPAATQETRVALESLADDFSTADAEAIKAIEAETRHDVKAVEYWLKDRVLRIPALAAHAELVHLGLTSEDVNNLAYARMQQTALREVLLPAHGELLAALATLAEDTRALPMLARTHGQPASPTTLGKELGVFLDRLVTALAPLPTFRLPGKLNGATGTYAALAIAYPQIDWPAFSARVIESLGLTPSLVTTQVEPHDGYAALYDALKRVNNILLDLAQDAWRYVSDGYFRQRAVAGEIGSSAMPHKINPIDFENAEGNLGLANALLVHFADKLTKSRLQRDLSDSTVLRNLGVAFGHTLVALQNLVRGLDRVAP
ncbi:MAG TPA: adenylosuccinate lyase, partial [Oscillatoriaceae cyanobacterium]